MQNNASTVRQVSGDDKSRWSIEIKAPDSTAQGNQSLYRPDSAQQVPARQQIVCVRNMDVNDGDEICPADQTTHSLGRHHTTPVYLYPPQAACGSIGRPIWTVYEMSGRKYCCLSSDCRMPTGVAATSSSNSAGGRVKSPVTPHAFRNKSALGRRFPKDWIGHVWNESNGPIYRTRCYCWTRLGRAIDGR